MTAPMVAAEILVDALNIALAIAVLAMLVGVAVAAWAARTRRASYEEYLVGSDEPRHIEPLAPWGNK